MNKFILDNTKERMLAWVTIKELEYSSPKTKGFMEKVICHDLYGF